MKIQSFTQSKADTTKLRKGVQVWWKNYLGIWQSALVEQEPQMGFVTVRRFPPEDSEGLPNTDTISLNVSHVFTDDPNKP